MKAKYNLSEVIRAYKSNLDKEENILKIIDCMRPLIKKCVRQAYWGEKEDVRQELLLAVIEAVNKMDVSDNEGRCVVFLENALRNRYFELYRKSKAKEVEDSVEMERFDCMEGQGTYDYHDVEFQVDLEQMLRLDSAIKRRIACYIICEHRSDVEIARQLKVSRQYVNKCKKEIFKNLMEYSKAGK